MSNKNIASKFIWDGIDGVLVEDGLMSDPERIEKAIAQIDARLRPYEEARRKSMIDYLNKHPEIWTTVYD